MKRALVGSAVSDAGAAADRRVQAGHPEKATPDGKRSCRRAARIGGCIKLPTHSRSDVVDDHKLSVGTFLARKLDGRLARTE